MTSLDERLSLRHQRKQWKGYNGKYRGKLLTPMEYQQYGNKRDFIMSNRTYYKEFCQFDHMEQDKDFTWYLGRFVCTNPLTDKGISQNLLFKNIYDKLKYITLNDIYLPSDEDRKYGCCVMGNSLMEWEKRQIKIILKDYIHFNRHRDEILEDIMVEDFSIDEQEMEDEYLNHDLFRKDVVTGEWKRDEDDDELPF